ncbi:related to IES2 Protein that associates with the INO80 chromatin remodeling complex under low-salt conditions [Rhynchosporium agropyri]|uniref:Related to IES2 Protein that associates with the INO80 chromatin remodeling complex under low-salt conditions n=1 Tax=Rhynchosporium agropyri TaxID=914238 RepID=A0A1E1LJN5_9HELO|nr:related to IES2 Protein that associates with the INO80 chromatin remodeling complex under low-salt conditions [Rhynchosporium agropyri]
MSSRRSKRSAAVKAKDAIKEVITDPFADRSSRARRNTNTSENAAVAATATVSRGPASGSAKSPATMRLTVKTSSSKLREATRSSPVSTSGGVSGANARDPFVGGKIIEGKRARNVRKSYVLESDSEEEDEDEEMDEAGDEDAEVEDDDDEDMDAEDDLLGDEDADGDVVMETEVLPPPPVIKVSKASAGGAKDVITVKPPVVKGKVLPVEQKEIEDASDDEELSDLDSDLGEEIEEEEGMQLGDEEDAEGEDEEIEVEEGDEEDDSLDSGGETPANGSRASTPDLNKLTKRQRARFEESDGGHLLALPDEVQVKKHLTAEEHAMRRAEMARRRKNLSEKRNEEEKLETINKLLKKQAPKTNARRAGMNLADNPNNSSGAEGAPFKPHPMYVRWVSNKDGNRIGVPQEWLEAPVGGVFGGSVKAASGGGGGAGMGGKLIEEVA